MYVLLSAFSLKERVLVDSIRCPLSYHVCMSVVSLRLEKFDGSRDRPNTFHTNAQHWSVSQFQATLLPETYMYYVRVHLFGIRTQSKIQSSSWNMESPNPLYPKA
jgi:hypothetical protein